MRTKAADPILISLIGDFLGNYLPDVRNRDEDTIDYYRFSINRYIDFMSEVNGITIRTLMASDFNQANIVKFMIWLADSKGNVTPTVNHRLSDIRNFCKYLQKKNVISVVVYEEIREIKDAVDDRLVDFTWLSIEDVKRVLNQTILSRDAIRDRFFLSVLYESGARVSEALLLKQSDLRPTKDGEVDVHFYGKGRKHRITPLSKEIWKQYKSYQEKYLELEDTNGLVFYTVRNGIKAEMSRDNISRILNNCEESAKKINPDGVSKHSG